MVTKTSLRSKGFLVAGAITVAAVAGNLADKSAHPLADPPFEAFAVDFGTTATSAGPANAITIQHTITGDIIPAPAPAPEYYVGRVIIDVRSRSNT